MAAPGTAPMRNSLRLAGIPPRPWMDGHEHEHDKQAQGQHVGDVAGVAGRQPALEPAVQRPGIHRRHCQGGDAAPAWRGKARGGCRCSRSARVQCGPTAPGAGRSRTGGECPAGAPPSVSLGRPSGCASSIKTSRTPGAWRPSFAPTGRTASRTGAVRSGLGMGWAGFNVMEALGEGEEAAFAWPVPRHQPRGAGRWQGCRLASG